MTDRQLELRPLRPADREAGEYAAWKRFCAYRDIDRDDVSRFIGKFSMIGDTRRNMVLHQPRDEQRFVFLCLSGWAIASVEVDGGQRYIHRLYRPGDLIGLEDTNWTYATSTASVIKSGQVLALEKAELIELLAKDGRVASILFGIAMLDQVMMIDRAQANARLPARWRVAHLLLTLEAEENRYRDVVGPCFPVPLTQGQIADSVGVTPVHTNRAFMQLIEEGYIARTGREYEILRRDDLIAETGWTDRHRIGDHLAGEDALAA